VTTQEQLTELQTAKTKILTQGQAYTAEGLAMTRADLGTINEEIARLERKLVQETRGNFAQGAIGYAEPRS